MLCGQRDIGGAGWHREEAVHEIEVGAIRRVAQHGRARGRRGVAAGVPTHVGHLERRRDGEAHHPARKNAQALAGRIFVAALEEHLHADADAQKRRALADGLHDGRAQGSARAVKPGHTAAKCALAGHHDLVGAGHLVGVAGDEGVGAYARQRLFHAAQVAAAAVDNGDAGLAHG